MKKQTQPHLVQLLYRLHRSPPDIIAVCPPYRWRVLLTGESFSLLGSHEIPVPGCPIPEKLFWANILYQARQRQKAILHALIGAVCLALFQFIIWLLEPNAMYEVRSSLLSVTGWVLSCVALLGLAFGAVAAMFWNFGKGLRFDFSAEPEPALLTAGATALPSLAPDVEVWSISPDETPAAYATRWGKLSASRGLGCWVVSIPYRSLHCQIAQDTGEGMADESLLFTRDTPPYESDQWTPEARTLQHDVRTETWEQYVSYLTRFTEHYRQWVAHAKARHADKVGLKSGDVLRESMKRTTVAVLLLLVMATGVSAQKQAKVLAQLQDAASTVYPAGCSVYYVFSAGTIKRDADGTHSVLELLPMARMYSDAGGGNLVGVTVRGKDGKEQTVKPIRTTRLEPANITVEPPPQAVGKSKDPVRPNAAPPLFDGQQQPEGVVWDSATVARNLASAKAQVITWRARLWQTAKPIWEFCMFLFGSVQFFLLAAGGLLWLIAITARHESEINPVSGKALRGGWIVEAHAFAAGWLLVFCWVQAVFTLLNSFLWMVWNGFDYWMILAVWAFELWASYRIIRKFVPNVRKSQVSTSHTSGVQPYNYD